MKKLVVYNDQLQKLFCRYDTMPTGCVSVSFYLPKDGFSICWLKTKYVKILDVSDQEDKRGRKYSRVDFLIHPTFWLGESFDAPLFKTPSLVIQKIADTIHILS